MSSRALAGAVALALASACGGSRGAHVDSEPPSIARAAPSGVLPASTNDVSPPIFDGSIYDLNLELTDQDGNKASLDLFRGHPVLVTMFYGRCSGACPLLMTDLKRIDSELAPSTRDKLRVLMVSFDSAHDTPAALSLLSRERNLDRARWKLASTTDDAARELSAVLGIKYRKMDNGAYFHSSVITLLDEAGRPKVRTEGLGKDPGTIVAAIR